MLGKMFFRKFIQKNFHAHIQSGSGHAVSVTSSVNQYFGAGRVSPTLGIIWNDEMDDFRCVRAFWPRPRPLGHFLNQPFGKLAKTFGTLWPKHLGHFGQSICFNLAKTFGTLWPKYLGHTLDKAFGHHLWHVGQNIMDTGQNI